MFCYGSGFGGYGHRGYTYGGPGIFMMILMLIVLFAAAYFIYKLISRKNLNTAYDNTSSEAVRILNERFAKGEISEEEFKIKKDQIAK